MGVGAAAPWSPRCANVWAGAAIAVHACANPPSAHPAPNYVGVDLLVMIMLAIIAAVALVGPDVVSEGRRMVDCMAKPEQAIC